MLSKIAILHHANEPRVILDEYIISWIAREWEKRGISVEHVYGVSSPVDADVVVAHVDLSVLPDEYANFVAHYPVVINGCLRDIRKRTISNNLVTRDCDYRGPVIVKTDLNHGGHPEVVIEGRAERPRKTLIKRLRLRAGFRDPHGIRGPGGYLVYPSLKRVPRSVFRNPRLVVEKFIPEPDGEVFNHRRYLYLGDIEWNEVWQSPNPINAGDKDCDRSWFEPPPQALRDLRSQLGADYGKIDYVIHEGHVEVFDVNRTPVGSPNAPRPIDAKWTRAVVDRLSAGIESWF
jgi:hypothetical protein